MSFVNKRIRVCFALLCCAALILSGFTGFCAEKIDTERDVSLTILYKYEKTVIPGAAFNLYRAADVSENAEFSVTEEFAGYSVSVNNRTDAQWRAAAAALAGYAVRDGIEPLKSGKTLSDGKLRFSGKIKPGLYLVIGNQRVINKVTYTSEPFLICLPNAGTDGKWEYDVSCSPKVSAVTEDPEKTDAPKPSPTPRRPSGGSSSGGGGSGTVIAGGDPVRPTIAPLPTGKPDSGEVTPGDAPSGGTPSGGTPSGGTTPDGTTPGGTPSDGTPSDGTTPGGTPADGTPAGGTPSDGTTPDGTTPGGTAPGGATEENPVTPGRMTDTVKAQKIWRDDENKAARPESVEIQLLRNGEVFAEAVLNEENNWRYTWTDLDASYMWQLVEKTVPGGYKVSVDMEGETQILINTYETGDTNAPGGSIPGVPSNTGTGGGSPGSGGKLPQTGQLRWPVSAMAAAGLFLFMCGWTLNRRQESEEI